MTTPDERRRELVAAYEGLEDARSFSDRSVLDAYRRNLLKRTSEQAALLEPHLGEQARVLEVGCGNGRLLIDLARRGRLAYGLGLDLAGSRIAFAREWAEDERLEQLRFEEADVLKFPLGADSFSAVFCITGTFAYFDALEAGLASRVARRLHEALEPSGMLWLELYPHPEYRRLLEAASGELRVWAELPAEDPWRFYLSRLDLDEGEILSHTKTFVHRTTGQIDEGRRERLYLYTPESIGALLLSVGFAEVQLLEGWGADPYCGGAVMVVVARPKGPDRASPPLME